MSFSDIKGHDKIIAFFRKGLALQKIGHAYIFYGPAGTGKMLFATTLSKALNCLKEDSDSCDECASCVKIEYNTHPDVSYVEFADQKESIGIEQIREVQRKINLKPYEAIKKVFIIQNSDLMTEEAANCLLKTIEEPPLNSVIILIASNLERVLPTVRSRCSRIKFDQLNMELRAGLFETNGFSKGEAVFLSRLANSGLNPNIGLGANEVFAYRDKALNELNSEKTLLDEASGIFKIAKDEMRFMLSIFESWFRDIIVLKSTNDESLLINADKASQLKALCAAFSFEALEEISQKIEIARVHIDRNVGPKIAFNALKIKIKETLGE